MKHLIAPSLLSANFLDLRKEVEMINKSDADWLHLDIMDGVFVPNISFGFPVLNALKSICQKPMDVHLMIVEPQKFIPEVAATGAYMMNVHYEACTHLHRTVAAIKETGMKAGVTLNPHTPICLLEDIIQDVDMVLLMSVNPGFGGQRFIEHSVDKVARLREMIDRKGLSTMIEVDGGVNLETGKRLVDAGANVLVAGNFVFKSPDPIQTIKESFVEHINISQNLTIMIEEIQKRPFVRPLFLWITGILCYAFLPASSLLYVLGVLSALVFLFLGFSCGRAHAELRYDSRWIWGAIVSVLIVCLAVEVCWYSDRRIALVNEPASSLDLLATKAQYSLVNTFDRLRLSDEEKSILATLTLGYKKAMSRETKRRFSLAGVSHILAVFMLP